MTVWPVGRLIILAFADTERQVDGDAFCSLTREDIAILFPDKGQFILGCKLYREVQSSRQTSVGKESDLSTDDPNHSSVSASVRTSFSSVPSVSAPSKSKDTLLSKFVMPRFPRDVEKALKDDRLQTSVLRNKLIREACRSLRGYCQAEGRRPTAAEKRKLGSKLYRLAPKSLGDPDGLAVTGVPEVSMPGYNSIDIIAIYMSDSVSILYIFIIL